MSKLLLATIALSLASLSSPASAKTSANKPIGAVVVHPLFKIYYSCAEHYAGQFKWSGDALGADCVVMRLRAVDRRYWARAYRAYIGEHIPDWPARMEAEIARAAPAADAFGAELARRWLALRG